MRFFHVSDNPNLNGCTVFPKLPESRMEVENSITPRICVSPSINGCLTATSRYEEGETLYIYECYSEAIIQPTEKDVIDAPLTGEMWIVEPTIFRRFGTIKITEVLGSNLKEMMNNLYAFEFVS